MYDFQPYQTFPSREFPGVSYTILKMTEGSRVGYRELLAEPNSRLGEMQDERARLLQAPDAQQDKVSIERLEYKMVLLQGSEINPAQVKWALEAVEGMTIQGTAITRANCLSMPPELFAEVLNSVQQIIGMTDAEIKNFVSLFISGTPVLSETNVTTAEYVSAPVTSAPATVLSSSPVVST
jgi:hypothetical protein